MKGKRTNKILKTVFHGKSIYYSRQLTAQKNISGIMEIPKSLKRRKVFEELKVFNNEACRDVSKSSFNGNGIKCKYRMYANRTSTQTSKRGRKLTQILMYLLLKEKITMT